MPDPIDELENFSIPGPVMTPLPAAEVRRRGNRIRRRNNALAAAGGLAVVAAIAVPFAVFAGNQTSSTEPPQPAPSVDWVTSIPPDIDLTAGLPRAETQDQYQRQAVEVCDGAGWTPEADPRPAEVRQVVQTETEGGWDRTLAVYPDGKAADLAFVELQARVEQCAASSDGQERWTEVVDRGTGGLAYVDHMSEVGDAFVNRVVQVGNALLVDTTYSMGTGDPQVVEDAVANISEKSAPVVGQMCVFSATGCGTSETAEDPAIGEGAVPAIPADFPLDEGLPTGGLDGTVPSPDPTATCEHPADRPKPVERAHAQWRSISEIRDRQLLTFSTQAEAEAYVDAVSTVDCSPDRVTTVSNYLDSDAMVAIGHNENAGTVGPGLVLTYVARVGRAVLLAQRIDEGYTWTDVQQETSTLADDTGNELAPLVDAMCPFTETGC